MAEGNKNPQRQRERTVSLHKGASSRGVPWLIEDTEAPELENVLLNTPGARSRRKGTRAFGGSHAAPGGLNGYSDETFNEFLVGVWGSSIYFSDLDGGWEQQATSVSLVSGLLHQIIPARSGGQLSYAVSSCERVTDTAVGLNGRSQLALYNIEDDSSTSASLAPRAIVAFQNRLFYGEGETIGWSEIGALADYSDTNNLLVEPGLGGEITSIMVTRDADPKLMIFKESSIHLFTPRWGTDSAIIPGAGDALDTINSSIRLMSAGVGCVATRSVAYVPGLEAADVLFLSADGIRSLQRAEQDVQTGAGLPLSWPIKTWTDRINYQEAHKAVSAVFDNAYHLAVPLDGAKDNTHVLRFDITNRAWSLHTWEARDLSSFKAASVDRLWLQNGFATGDSSTTNAETDVSNYPFQIFSLFEGDIDPSTDVTNPVRPGLLEISKSYTLQDPMVKKRWNAFSMELSSGETSALEIAYRADQGGWNVVTDIKVIGTADTTFFAIDALPWEAAPDFIRRQTFSLSDIPPSYHLQIRIMTTSNSTESGRPVIYFSEVSGHTLTNDFANDV